MRSFTAKHGTQAVRLVSGAAVLLLQSALSSAWAQQKQTPPSIFAPASTPAPQVFDKVTAPLRRDLRLSASGARWFYSNLDTGFRALTAPFFRGAVVNAYANGTKIAALANAVRRFASVFAAGN